MSVFKRLESYVIKQKNKKFKKMFYLFSVEEIFDNYHNMTQLINVALYYSNITVLKIIYNRYQFPCLIFEFILDLLNASCDFNIEFINELFKIDIFLGNKLVNKVLVSFNYNDNLNLNILLFLALNPMYTIYSIDLFLLNTIDKYSLIFQFFWYENNNNYLLFNHHKYLTYETDNGYNLYFKYKFIQYFPEKDWTDENGNSLIHIASSINNILFFKSLIL